VTQFTSISRGFFARQQNKCLVSLSDAGYRLYVQIDFSRATRALHLAAAALQLLADLAAACIGCCAGEPAGLLPPRGQAPLRHAGLQFAARQERWRYFREMPLHSAFDCGLASPGFCSASKGCRICRTDRPSGNSCANSRSVPHFF